MGTLAPYGLNENDGQVLLSKTKSEDSCTGFSVTLKKGAKCTRNIGVIQKRNVLYPHIYIYLAGFMKTAPAGSWRPHTLN